MTRRLNPAIADQPERISEVLPRLRATALSAVNDGLIVANERMTTWLRGHQTMRFLGTERLPVHLIDFVNPNANRLRVSGEVEFGPPSGRRRFDIVLWVSGLPLWWGKQSRQ